MALPAFETNLNIIQQLDDEPNDVGGLTAAELKAKFDEAGLTIQTWINETLLPAMIAANLAFAKTTDIPADTVQAAIENVQESSAAATQALGNTLSATEESLQGQITENYNALHEELLQAVIGSIPDASVTYRKLASDITTILTTLQTGLSQAQSKIEELDGREIVIDPATQTKNGLMSATDKVKLDGIAANATRVLVDNALSETSTNAIQNRAVKAALAELMQSISQALEGKAAKVHTHTKANITDLTFDTEPTENSQNLVTSGGVFSALSGVLSELQNFKTATQYTGTLLATGWAEDSHGYQAQTITITGLAASYDVDPQWDVVLSGTDPDADASLLEGFALIHNYTTGANSLTAQCIGAAPTVNIPVKVVVFG